MTADPLALLMSMPGIGPAIPYITLAVAIASMVAAVIPPPAPASSTAYAAFYAVIHRIALNWGNAKAASAPDPAAPSTPVVKS